MERCWYVAAYYTPGVVDLGKHYVALRQTRAEERASCGPGQVSPTCHELLSTSDVILQANFVSPPIWGLCLLRLSACLILVLLRTRSALPESLTVSRPYRK